MRQRRRLRLVALVSGAWGALVACGPSDAPPPAGASRGGAPWFTEVSSDAGLAFRHVSGQAGQYLFPEAFSGGACLLDHDADGDLDLYLVQGGRLAPGPEPPPANVLMENLGGLRFGDATARAGVGDPGYGMGCTTGDPDADGDVDLHVTNVGPNVLFRNEGDGTFADATDASPPAARRFRWPRARSRPGRAGNRCR